jgi:hypothetical protein
MGVRARTKKAAAMEAKAQASIFSDNRIPGLSQGGAGYVNELTGSLQPSPPVGS